MADSLEAFPVSNLHQYDITLVFKQHHKKKTGRTC